MFRTMLKSKIHRATVTQADLHYVGSVTVDEDLMDAADLLPGEQIAIVDVTNGVRLETYVIPGERGSGHGIDRRARQSGAQCRPNSRSRNGRDRRRRVQGLDFRGPGREPAIFPAIRQQRGKASS